MSSKGSVWGSNSTKSKSTLAQVLKSKSELKNEIKSSEDSKKTEDKKIKKTTESKIQITSDYPNFVMNALGVKRYSLQDIYNCAEKYTDMPESLKNCTLSCVIGHEAVVKSIQTYEDEEVEKSVKAKEKVFKTEEDAFEASQSIKEDEQPWHSASTDPKTISNLLQVNDILSKLSVDNVNTIATSLVTIIQDTIGNLPSLFEIVNLIISKAVSESSYYIIYGDMCKSIYSSLNPEDAAVFKNALLMLCQTFFDKCNGIIYEVEGVSSLEISISRDNKKSILRLIGQLYNNDLVATPVIKYIINDLGYHYIEDEDAVDTLIQFIHIVGPKFDQAPKTRIYMTAVFRVFYEWEHSNELNSRIIFLLRCLRELRHKEWRAKDVEMSKDENETIEDNDNEWETTDIPSKKDKSSKKHKKNNRIEKEVDPQQIEFRNFWIDLVSNKMIDMAVVSLASMDVETKTKLVAAIINTLPMRSINEQKSISALLSQLIHSEGLTEDIIKAGILMSITNYSEIRRREFYSLATSFTRLFINYFMNKTVTIEDIFTNWTYTDDNAAYLLELLSCLLTELKTNASDIYEDVMTKKLVTIKTIFNNNNYTYIYINRMIKKYNFKNVAGVLTLN